MYVPRLEPDPPEVVVTVESRRPPDEGRLLQLVYYAYVWGSAIARALPERLVYGCAHLLGSLGARISKQRIQVAKNMARVTSEPIGSSRLEAIVADAYRSYARYWLETFRLVREDREFFLERTHVSGTDNLDSAMAQGRGAVVAIAHLGNWDAAGAWAGAAGYRIVTVAEPLRPKRMFDFFVRHREKLGMTIHAAQPGATDVLADAARNGALVPILADRDLRARGPIVEFFGEEANFPAGPAIVALKSGSPLLVAGIYSEIVNGKRGWLIEFGGPLPVTSERSDEGIAEVTQRVAHALEGLVAKRPEEWHVFQPFWRTDRIRQ
jgi:phosphatidylinositol dimannoside acyltransferase